ncbi:DUF4190 domain-containing protein [Demequina sp. B12]|uniref:DUF4190 domain-containing protein n=1 Tax=Demequina sp. B12 TaxID=2992757 RepID=UPI00237B7853|nr:DUF4190 domain-containing protein [Demequina sp. B12]MDE0572386.1 DUF4190 domain-containing protein [Demequina sp. B12]
MSEPSVTPSQPAAEPGTNVFAILAIIFVWFTGILGLVFGYIALSQIKRTGERGHGMAVAAVVLGWIAVAIAVIILLLVALGFIGAVANA